VKQETVYPTEDKVLITKAMVEMVKSYCPAAIKCSDTGVFMFFTWILFVCFYLHSKRGIFFSISAVFIAENRIISVLFVNLDLVYVSGQQNLEQLQRGIIAMQQEIYKYRGEVRQFIVDDKGSVLIGTLGVCCCCFLLLLFLFFFFFFFCCCCSSSSSSSSCCC
jgi:hypothetical protein